MEDVRRNVGALLSLLLWEVSGPAQVGGVGGLVFGSDRGVVASPWRTSAVMMMLGRCTPNHGV